VFDHDLQTAQHGEGLDDATVQRGLERAAQGVGNVPDEVGQVLLVHGAVVSQQRGRRLCSMAYGYTAGGIGAIPNHSPLAKNSKRDRN
jgi:hypothetical protein